MQIDLFYFNGCPSWHRGLENPKAVLSAEGKDAEIRLVRLEDYAEAARLRLLGSPSFRVNIGLSRCSQRLKKPDHLTRF